MHTTRLPTSLHAQHFPELVMAYPSDSDDLPSQLFRQIYLSANSEQMLLRLVEKLVMAWPVTGALWIVGRTSSDCQIVCWKDESAIFLPEPIVQGIASQPIVQELQTAARERKSPESSAVVLPEIDPKQNSQLADTLHIDAGLALATQLQGETNGLLIIGSDRPRDWMEGDRVRLQNIAPPLAIAARLWMLRQHPAGLPPEDFSENSSPLNLPRNIYSQGSPIVQKLYALMRQQFEQQRQLNKLKDDIIDAISHETRTPLTAMRMAVSMLRRTPKNPDTQTRYLDVLEQECDRLNGLISSIITFKMLESQELTYNPVAVDFLGLVATEGELVQSQWQEDTKKQLKLTIKLDKSFKSRENGDRVGIYSDPQHLRSILSELLENARKFSAPRSTVTVAISVPNAQTLQMSVCNRGYPIEAGDIGDIFQPFRRGKGMTERAIAGTGIGLALVKGLVELLKGRIEATCDTSEASDWANIAFKVDLPCNPPQS